MGRILFCLCFFSTVFAGAYRAEILRQRQEKDRQFKTDLLSPMAASQRWTFTKGPTLAFDSTNGTLQETNEQEEGSPLQFYGSEKNWLWRTTSDQVDAQFENTSQKPGPIQSGMIFRVGRFTLQVYPDGDRLTVIQFDSRRSLLAEFKHLYYFEPDPTFNVKAKIERLEKPERAEMLTSQNLVKTFLRFAKLRFELNGQEYTLFAYKMSLSGPSSHLLFIPFSDATTASSTYLAGRFLELDEPSGNMLQLDFNLAFNPLCNYAPAFNCPRPLAENELPIAILAGEKTYPNQRHGSEAHDK